MEEAKKQLPELRLEDLPFQEIEARALISERVFELAVKNTKSSDWVDFGGNPWLDTPGAERLARAFGITVADTHFEKLDRQDRDGPYYIYIWYGRVGLAKQSIWIDAIGACSSKKPFHSMEHGKRKHLEDINEMNILKDGYSNMVENGVTRFLGLRGLDWETLEKAGVLRAKAVRVDFKKHGEEKPAPKEDPKTEHRDEGVKTDPKTQGFKAPPPPPPNGKTANPKTRGSLIDYAVARVLATRDEIAAEISEKLTMAQCNYVLTNLAKLQGDIKIDTFKDIVRGAAYRGGAQ